MKTVLMLTFVIAVIMSTGIGCLVIFGMLTVDQGLNYGIKALATIVLLGIASAVISLVTRSGSAPEK